MAENQIVYALVNPAMPGLVKIGKTTQADISMRMGQLYSTGVPVPFRCVYAVQVEDCTNVEKQIHIAFGPYKINPNREFFEIEPEQAVSVLKLLGPNDATKRISDQLSQNVSKTESDSGDKLTTKRRPRLDFHQLNIADGEILNFLDDDSITVEVISNRKVRYNGQTVSLSKATQKILQLDYLIQPSPKWEYNGVLLKELYEEYYAEEEV